MTESEIKKTQSAGKIVLKVVTFIAIFILLWALFQSFLAYNWNRNELLTSRYADYESMESGEVDVLFFGPSTMYADIAPMAIWDEEGITSYNMGTSNQIPFLTYYQFEYLLTIDKPEVIVLDFSGIALDKDIDVNQDMESIYRKMTDTMPDREIKNAMIDDICAHFDTQKKITYYIPLLRDHDRWEDLSSYDFNRKKVFDSYEPWTRGGAQNNDVEVFDWPDNLFRAENNEAVELYIEYYQKLVDLCNDEGIKVLVYLSPKMALRPGDYLEAKEFSKENSLNFLAYATRPDMEGVGLNPAEDFYDEMHLNVKGQAKLSRAVSRYLKENYDLVNHKDDPAYDSWNELYKEYETRYNELVEEM